jgi:hypothetical protein
VKARNKNNILIVLIGLVILTLMYVSQFFTTSMQLYEKIKADRTTIAALDDSLTKYKAEGDQIDSLKNKMYRMMAEFDSLRSLDWPSYNSGQQESMAKRLVQLDFAIGRTARNYYYRAKEWQRKNHNILNQLDSLFNKYKSR